MALAKLTIIALLAWCVAGQAAQLAPPGGPEPLDAAEAPAASASAPGDAQASRALASVALEGAAAAQAAAGMACVELDMPPRLQWPENLG